MVHTPSFPATYQPQQPIPRYQPQPQQYAAQQPQYQPQYQQQYQQPQYQQQYQTSPQPQQYDHSTPALPTNHGVSTTDIIWVSDEQEVQNYPVAQNQNGMFMDINRLKLYTKDGSNGLIRDFDLVESEESLNRYHQMKQIEKAQFPVIDSTAVEDGYSHTDIKEIENQMNQKFDILEQHIAELTKSINNNGYRQPQNRNNQNQKNNKSEGKA